MSTAVHCAVAVLEESREMKLFSFSTEAHVEVSMKNGPAL